MKQGKKWLFFFKISIPNGPLEDPIHKPVLKRLNSNPHFPSLTQLNKCEYILYQSTWAGRDGAEEEIVLSDHLRNNGPEE